MYIERKVVSDDGLERTVYKFEFILHYYTQKPYVQLASVLKEVKASKRHRTWRTTGPWRNNGQGDAPELPSGMVDSVLKEIRDSIVYREPEKRGR